jgi:hypothetical protein
MAGSSHPGAPLEDPHRVKLMEMIAEGLGRLSRAHTKTINKLKACYACLWLADIKKLKDWVEYLPNKPLALFALLELFEFECRIGQICR